MDKINKEINNGTEEYAGDFYSKDELSDDFKSTTTLKISD